MEFREDQKPIMNYTGGTMAVPAVPGAGKTFIITNLVSKLIDEERQKPGKILIVTYMNSAVNNFKSRIRAISGATNEFEVMTIHSLALKILKEKPSAAGLNEEFNVIDDYRQRAYMDEAVQKWILSGGNSILESLINEKYKNKYDTFIQDFKNVSSTLIGELKLNGIRYEDIKNNDKLDASESIIHKISGVYDLYERILKSNGYVDYNDLLSMALKLIRENEDIRKRFQKRYTYIFEDECQDSNLVQGQILEIISEQHKNLVRVGDINQSITGTFTSSNPEFFKDFCEKAQRKYVMDMAGRSSKDIINAANFLVDFVRGNDIADLRHLALENQIIKPVPLGQFPINPCPIESSVNFNKYKNKEEEIIETINKIKEIRESGENKTIAVLFPTNAEVEDTAISFKNEGVEFDELSSNSLERTRVNRILKNVFAFMADTNDKQKLFYYIENTAFENEIKEPKIIEKIKNSTIRDLVFNTSKIFQDLLNDMETHEDALKVVEVCESLKKILEYNDKKPESIILYIGSLFNLSEEDMAIIEATAFYTKLYIKDKLVKNYEDLANILFNKNNIINHVADVIYEMKGYEPSKEKVTLCTYHKSKGLEWDYVFLLGLKAYNFPSKTSDYFKGNTKSFVDNLQNPIAVGKNEIKILKELQADLNPVYKSRVEYINERARLLYVGITRAREGLYLSTYLESQYNGKTFNEKESGFFTYLSRLNNL